MCGPGTHSDIALDQIQLEEGGCPEGTLPKLAVQVDSSGRWTYLLFKPHSAGIAKYVSVQYDSVQLHNNWS